MRKFFRFDEDMLLRHIDANNNLARNVYLIVCILYNIMISLKTAEEKNQERNIL